jgi:hypothetical protein
MAAAAKPRCKRRKHGEETAAAPAEPTMAAERQSCGSPSTSASTAAHEDTREASICWYVRKAMDDAQGYAATKKVASQGITSRNLRLKAAAHDSCQIQGKANYLRRHVVDPAAGEPQPRVGEQRGKRVEARRALSIQNGCRLEQECSRARTNGHENNKRCLKHQKKRGLPVPAGSLAARCQTAQCRTGTSCESAFATRSRKF